MPSSQSVEVTTTAVFHTTVSGVGKNNFSYQWRYNGKKIRNASEKYLYIQNVMEHDSGNYQCIISNECGDSSASKIVVLFVTSE